MTWFEKDELCCWCCDWWRPARSQDGHGHCLAKPPKRSSEKKGDRPFPVTHDDDFCRAFSNKNGFQAGV